MVRSSKTLSESDAVTRGRVREGGRRGCRDVDMVWVVMDVNAGRRGDWKVMNE